MEALIYLAILFIAIYPCWLVWRFLTLGIKAFKKYLSDYSEYDSE